MNPAMNNFLVRIPAIIIWITILGILYFNKSSNDQMYTEKQEKSSNYSIIYYLYLRLLLELKMFTSQ